jgi:hypothetical protein
MLAIENNPLLTPFLLVLKASGNEFKNPNKTSKLVWVPHITEENEEVYARYVKIIKAFPKCIHSGFGSSECFCPPGSDVKKAQYVEMCDNIVSHLSDAPLIFSEVAIRKNLIMQKGDVFHHDGMARNVEVKVQQVTATRIIAEFMRSIEIVGKQYDVKTYTTPYDGIVDMQNAQLEGVGPLLSAEQKQELAERVTYMKKASVALCPDHVFGEPMKNPEERMDPRSLTAEQWIEKDWRSIHARRVPAVRVNTVGKHINDRADQTAHQLQRSHFQPMIFMGDHIPAQRAYNEGQRISRENEVNERITARAAFKAAMEVHMEICYRDFYNGGKSWALCCHGKHMWTERIWINYHMRWAGYTR